ncbi:hypothetical protein [Natronosalvus vescus]|uniref:hypothetical protein n=1 Tax=Natronosalvus vescus TaxID=2953881 RepID=UPI0020911A1B|nr:hypothetical protein [Natronosalvus vescus]
MASTTNSVMKTLGIIAVFVLLGVLFTGITLLDIGAMYPVFHTTVVLIVLYLFYRLVVAVETIANNE